MKRVYLLLPLASLIAHLSMLHWVYRVQFVGADLSPVLLGLMVAIGREAWASRSELVVLRIVMPLAAMTMAINFPPVVYVYASAGLRLTPGEITMAAAYAAVVYCFFGAWAKYLLTGGAAVATVMLFGPSRNRRGLPWRRVTGAWLGLRIDLCLRVLLNGELLRWAGHLRFWRWGRRLV